MTRRRGILLAAGLLAVVLAITGTLMLRPLLLESTTPSVREGTSSPVPPPPW